MLLSTAQLRGNRQQLRLMLLISPPRLQCYLLFFMPLFPLLLLLCCCAVAGNSFASAVVAARARQKKEGDVPNGLLPGQQFVQQMYRSC